MCYFVDIRENPEDFAAGLKHIEAEHKRQQELEKQQMEEEKKQLAEKAAKRQEEVRTEDNDNYAVLN